MRYIKRIDEYFSNKEELELKDTVGNNKFYFDLTYDKYKNVESPSGNEVINDLKFVLELFPELTIRQIYPLFTLVINNKKYLRDFNYNEFVTNGNMAEYRNLTKEINKYIIIKSRVKLKTFLPKDTDLQRQIKSINFSIGKKSEYVTKDTLQVNELYKLLNDNNINYLSIFYKMYLNGVDYGTILNYIESLLSINASIDELKGDLNNVLSFTKPDKQLEFLQDFHRTAKIDVAIEDLLSNNLFYKDDKNKSVLYKYVYQLIFQENIKANTDYLKSNPITTETKKAIENSTQTDFKEFVKEVKTYIKGPETREDVLEIVKDLGNNNAQVIKDVQDDKYNFIIVLSKSYDANKELTCGTSWCTATAADQANKYTVKNMDYYIFNYNAKIEDHKIIGLNFDILTKKLESITYKNSNEVGIEKQSEVEKIIGIELDDDSVFCNDQDIIDKILTIYKKVDNDSIKKYKEVLDKYNIKNQGFERYYEYLFNFTPKNSVNETLEYYGIFWDPIKKIIECNLDKKQIDYLASNDILPEEIWGNVEYNE